MYPKLHYYQGLHDIVITFDGRREYLRHHECAGELPQQVQVEGHVYQPTSLLASLPGHFGGRGVKANNQSA